MRLVVVVLALVVAAPPAHAGNNLASWLVGPVLGVRLGGGPGSHLVIGFEGGGGYGPERFNLGFEHREGKDVGYVEIDPWYIVGGTLGIGLDSDGKAVPVLGVWEGMPLNSGPCDGWHDQLTISGGYRYTGVHEMYVTVKAGRMDGSFCFD